MLEKSNDYFIKYTGFFYGIPTYRLTLQFPNTSIGTGIYGIPKIPSALTCFDNIYQPKIIFYIADHFEVTKVLCLVTIIFLLCDSQTLHYRLRWYIGKYPSPSPIRPMWEACVGNQGVRVDSPPGSLHIYRGQTPSR